MFGNCNHCCFCCGHPCTMLGVSLSISCKNKIQCVCVEKKNATISKSKKKKKEILHILVKVHHFPSKTTFHKGHLTSSRQIFLEHLLCTRNYAKNLRYISEENKDPFLHKAFAQVG